MRDAVVDAVVVVAVVAVVVATVVVAAVVAADSKDGTAFWCDGIYAAMIGHRGCVALILDTTPLPLVLLPRRVRCEKEGADALCDPSESFEWCRIGNSSIIVLFFIFKQRTNLHRRIMNELPHTNPIRHQTITSQIVNKQRTDRSCGRTAAFFVDFAGIPMHVNTNADE